MKIQLKQIDAKSTGVCAVCTNHYSCCFNLFFHDEEMKIYQHFYILVLID